MPPDYFYRRISWYRHSFYTCQAHLRAALLQHVSRERLARTFPDRRSRPPRPAAPVRALLGRAWLLVLLWLGITLGSAWLYVLANELTGELTDALLARKWAVLKKVVWMTIGVGLLVGALGVVRTGNPPIFRAY